MAIMSHDLGMELIPSHFPDDEDEKKILTSNAIDPERKRKRSDFPRGIDRSNEKKPRISTNATGVKREAPAATGDKDVETVLTPSPKHPGRPKKTKS